MRSREEVLREFGLALCDKGDTCTHYDCTGERRMADRIRELEAQQTAGEPVACRCGKCPALGLVDVDLSDKAHPRPRVGVTEATPDPVDAEIERTLTQQTGAFLRDKGLDMLDSLADDIALADSPAPLANGGGEVARG